MPSTLSGKLRTAVTVANSHDRWHCGCFHTERSRIQGLAWVEFVWCAAASNQFRCMTATQGTLWVRCGFFGVPYGPSTSRETEELPKYRTVLSVSSPLGRTITIPSGFPTLIPPYPFFPSSFCSGFFLFPFILSHISFFVMILFLLINLLFFHLSPFKCMQRI